MNNQAERETGEATGKQTSLVLMTPTSKAPRVAPPLSTTASRGFTNHQGQLMSVFRDFSLRVSCHAACFLPP
jgi:hypothetical protein